jgi:hypothetical protein
MGQGKPVGNRGGCMVDAKKSTVGTMSTVLFIMSADESAGVY